MFPVDFRAVFLSYVIINIVNLILIASLYVQIKKRFPGTFLVLISFFMNAIGNILLFLRNYIPDWISISLANVMLVSSTVILLIGFERFVKIKGVHVQNYLLIIIFSLVHAYFTFLKPDLNARIMNFSAAYVLLSIQIAYLMLVKTPVAMRKITRPVGIVFCAVGIIQISYIILVWQRMSNPGNYFNSESSETFYLLVWEIVLILLAYSIILMYNRHLLVDINIQEEKFSKAFHAAPFIIMLSKLENGEIFEVNKTIYSISGYQPDELINKKTTDVQIWEKDDDRHAFITDLDSKGKAFENEYVFRKKSGELFTGLVSADTIEINNEQCIISVISDISERKKIETKLAANEASFRELNSTKDKFFSIIAHDLKSPFNGILGFSELLIEQIKNKNYTGIDKYAEIIHKSSQRAINLLMNLMDWSRFQTGRMEFNPEYLEADLLIRSVKEQLNISAEKKSIGIALSLSDKVIVYADKFMLETILRNLISNAIKFTHKNGTVQITLEEKEKEFLFMVEDSGVGIDKQNLDKLFRIDDNVTSPGTENETGTGLGLILCKDFVKKHKGAIWVETEIGFGSKFYFTLPKV